MELYFRLYSRSESILIIPLVKPFFVELNLMSQAIKVYDDLGWRDGYHHTQT